MEYIELDSTAPNQSFTYNTQEGTVEIHLRTIDNITLMSIISNGNNVVSSIKVSANIPLIKYDYLQKKYGDFVFSTTDNEYPIYTNFNGSNKLYHISYEEAKELENGNNK